MNKFRLSTQKKKLSYSMIVLLLAFITSCIKSNKSDIDSFRFAALVPPVDGVISTTAKTVTVTVPSNTDVTALVPTIAVSDLATITPGSGVAQNFTTPLTYKVTAEDGTFTNYVVTVVKNGQVVTTNPIRQIKSNLTISATWYADTTYIVTGHIYLNEGVTLTIQPGTLIKFNSASGLYTGSYNNTALIANGTADKHITFTSNSATVAAGDWDGLFFNSKTLSNSIIKYCDISYAGSAVTAGAVDVTGCALNFSYSSVSYSKGYGILCEDGAAGFQTFTNNTITNTASHSIYLASLHVPEIGTVNTLTATGKGILVRGNADYTTGAVTWKKQTVDYYIENHVALSGNITIEAGTTIRFNVGGYMDIGNYNQNSTTLTAIGTTDKPITFTSATATPAAGDWKYLYIYQFTSASTIFDHCIFDYSGSTLGNNTFSIRTDASITIQNSQINHTTATKPAVRGSSTITVTESGNNFTFQSL
jgi:hypothetical protein